MPDTLSTPELCVAIIKRMVVLANEGKVIRLADDSGGNSLTVAIDDAHTHVGFDDQFDHLAQQLHYALHGWSRLLFVTVNQEAANG